MSGAHNDRRRDKLCALVAALQLEPLRVEDLVKLSGMHHNAVRAWLKSFEKARLVQRQELPTQGKPRLWAWRFA